MSQNSLVLPTSGTVSGLQMTQYSNQAIDTLNTLASGASAPGTPEAGQLWHDTTNNLIKIRSLDNTSWIPFLQLNESSYLAAPYASSQMTGFANRIINGAMDIDQVNEGASYTLNTANSYVYTVDQWEIICKSSTASGLTGQRVADAPPGLVNSLKLTIGTGASSVGSTDVVQITQPLEGTNVSDLAYGTSAAIAASLSFWVKSSVTGTYSVLLANSGGARTYVTTFTIGSAGVWQLVKIANIPGDQSGTWPSNNTQGLTLSIVPAAGTGTQTSTLNAWQSGAFIAANTQTSALLTTTGATFQITGVMLNAGSFCLPFEKHLAQQDLQLCERYYQKSFSQGTAVAQGAGVTGSLGVCSQAAATFGATCAFRTPMRTTPTTTTYNPVSANANWRDVSSSADRTVVVVSTSDKNVFIDGTSGASGTNNNIHFSASARM